MSTTDHTRFDELMSRYLDASLEAAGERELLRCLSDEALAARFYELTQLDTEIAGLLAGCLRDEVMIDLVWSDLAESEAPSPSPRETRPAGAVVPVPVARRREPTKRTGWLLVLAAVVAGVLGLTALCFHRFPATAVPGPAGAAPAKIASAHGEVYLVGSGGQALLSSGQALSGESTVETVGPDSRATLTLSDGTRIELLGDTSFSTSEAPDRPRLLLERGVIRCSVTHQPADAPMVFNTPEATATVRGTDLALVTVKSETLLVVTKGKVALRRLSGGPELLVEDGFYSRVEKSGNFHARPLAFLPKVDRDRVLPPE